MYISRKAISKAIYINLTSALEKLYSVNFHQGKKTTSIFHNFKVVYKYVASSFCNYLGIYEKTYCLKIDFSDVWQSHLFPRKENSSDFWIYENFAQPYSIFIWIITVSACVSLHSWRMTRLLTSVTGVSHFCYPTPTRGKMIRMSGLQCQNNILTAFRNMYQNEIILFL